MRGLLLGACVLATLALFGAGCGSDEPEPASGVERFSDLDEPIEVEAGSEFELLLDSNVTTGYQWQPAGRLPNDVITYEGSEYEAEPGAEDRAGAGGTQALRFRAVGPGEAELELEYVFGEGTDGREPAETRSVRVTVD